MQRDGSIDVYENIGEMNGTPHSWASELRALYLLYRAVRNRSLITAPLGLLKLVSIRLNLAEVLEVDSHLSFPCPSGKL